ncbi:unnamed protein product [Prunus armeniaca]
MSRDSGLDRTVGLVTIARSNGSQNLNPRVCDFGVSRTPIHNPLRSNGSTVLNPEITHDARSVWGSNVVRIEICEFLHARDNMRIILGLNVVPTDCPHAATRAGSV